MSVISMKQLLEAGVHFGHQTRRWKPENGRIHFHREERYIHYRPSENCEKGRRGLLFLKRSGNERPGSPVL